MKKLDLVGQRFGRLVVLEPVKVKTRRLWLCQCDCKKTTTLTTGALRSGNTKSCGCNSPFKFKHGFSGSKLESKYYDMKRRCYSAKCQGYKYYGGRGITVCEEWKNNPTSFYEWAIHNGYEPHLELDRIDVDGNYCPGNCRFVTHQENTLNRRICKNSVAAKARQRKLNPATVASRLHRGWTLDKALNTEVIR